MIQEYVGHVTYDLIYANEEQLSSTQIFHNFDDLFHRVSFTHLRNMQIAYEINEVRIADVYIQGLPANETQSILERIHEAELDELQLQTYAGQVNHG